MQDDLDVVIDELADRPAPTEVERAFGERWRVLGRQCRASLRTGELMTADLRRHAAADDEVDFAPAVNAYSRELEAELVDKPLRAVQGLGPAASRGPATRTSTPACARSPATSTAPPAKAPTLDVMAHCLLNIAHRLQDAPDNGFLAFLEARLTDPAAFCRAFAPKLTSYVDRFRNRAAHIDHISAADVDDARAFLLNDPRLLL